MATSIQGVRIFNWKSVYTIEFEAYRIQISGLLSYLRDRACIDTDDVSLLSDIFPLHSTHSLFGVPLENISSCNPQYEL